VVLRGGVRGCWRRVCDAGGFVCFWWGFFGFSGFLGAFFFVSGGGGWVWGGKTGRLRGGFVGVFFFFFLMFLVFGYVCGGWVWLYWEGGLLVGYIFGLVLFFLVLGGGGLLGGGGGEGGGGGGGGRVGNVV